MPSKKEAGEQVENPLVPCLFLKKLTYKGEKEEQIPTPDQ